MAEYVNVIDLPEPVQAALKAVDYHRENIRVTAAETVQLGNRGSGDGRQAFATLINLSTGEHLTTRGSWGGINMFDRINPVDNDSREFPLPSGGVAITGTRGGGHPVWANLHIPASMVARILTAGPTARLPMVEMDALYCHGSIKGGAYRRDELARHKVPASVVDDLIDRGLLKRNKAGATSITTAGKNAVGDYPGYGY